MDTDILVGTRASYNILVAGHASDTVTTVGMEHMNLNAYPRAYQKKSLKLIKSRRDYYINGF